MPNVLPIEQVRRVERLLDQQISQRETARRLRVSRGVVGQIARGDRPDYETRARQHKQRREAEEALLPAGPFEKCPTCGVKVQMPCVACRARAAKKEGSGFRGQGSAIAELLRHSPVIGLELKPGDRARYEEVKRVQGSGVRDQQAPCPLTPDP